MALADSVPGVSGGTVAFILGFYDNFVNALNNLISSDKIGRINALKFLTKIGVGWVVGFILSVAFILGFYDNFVNALNNLISSDKIGRINALKFLTKIGVGWVVGFILSVLFITSIFEKNIYEINSLFLGFIIASIPIIVKSEKKTLLRNNKNIIFLIIGIIVVCGLTYFNPITSKGHSFSVRADNLSLAFGTLLRNNKNIIFLIIGIIVVCGLTYFNPITSKGHSFSVRADNLSLAFGTYIFISGMIAISAMVLPGISGSTILLIFGIYTPILNAIKQVLKFNFEYLPSIIIFGFGIIAGILLTVRVVRSLLRKFRAQTIYCIIGLMIGSIYAVIMGPTSLEIPRPPMSLATFSIVSLLRKFRAQTIYCIIGLMIGSIYAVIMGPTSLEIPRPPMSLATFSIVFFAIGCTLVPALEKLKVILEKKNIESMTTQS